MAQIKSYICFGCMTLIDSTSSTCKCKKAEKKKPIKRAVRFEYEFVLWIGDDDHLNTNVEHYTMKEVSQAAEAFSQSTRTDKHITINKIDLRTEEQEEFDISDTLPSKKADRARQELYTIVGEQASYWNQDTE